MPTAVITERVWRGFRHNVVCPEHGKIGKSGVKHEAEQLAIKHEMDKHFHIEQFV